MFRIKASYKDQVELKTSIKRAREFFGELRNFADLMPGIEGIRRDASGIMRWIVRAEVPVIGAVHASFAVEKTEDEPDRLEWSPIPGEMKKRVAEMIRTFLERARVKLESLESEANCEPEAEAV